MSSVESRAEEDNPYDFRHLLRKTSQRQRLIKHHWDVNEIVSVDQAGWQSHAMLAGSLSRIASDGPCVIEEWLTEDKMSLRLYVCILDTGLERWVLWKLLGVNVGLIPNTAVFYRCSVLRIWMKLECKRHDGVNRNYSECSCSPLLDLVTQ